MKTFKIEDKAVKKTNKSNCTCGAWITCRPNHHSEWCDLSAFNDLTEEMLEKWWAELNQ